MKATKKIVGAACALVAAVALSAGSTFAWFVSNGTVTATGLTVDVVTSNSYLIISDDVNTLSDNKTTISLAPAEGTDADKLNPSAHETVTSNNDLINVSNWYTGKGTSPTDGKLDADTKETLAAFTGYVVVDDIYISVAAGSEAVTSVKMTMTEGTGWDSTVGNSAISVVLLWQNVTTSSAASETWEILEANAANSHAAAGVDLGGVTSEQYIQLKVMVYFDGNNTDVKGANAKDLKGVTLNFSFEDGTTTTDDTIGGEDNP